MKMEKQGQAGGFVGGALPLHFKMGKEARRDVPTKLGERTSGGWPWEEGGWVNYRSLQYTLL